MSARRQSFDSVVYQYTPYGKVARIILQPLREPTKFQTAKKDRLWRKPKRGNGLRYLEVE